MTELKKELKRAIRDLYYTIMCNYENPEMVKALKNKIQGIVNKMVENPAIESIDYKYDLKYRLIGYRINYKRNEEWTI